MVSVLNKIRERRLTTTRLVGFYSTNGHDLLMRCNPTAQGILHLSDDGHLPSRKLAFASFYARPGERRRFLRHAKAFFPDIVRTVSSLTIGDSRRIVAESCLCKLTLDGRAAGYEGAIIDITEQERLREKLEKLPIGFYEVDADDVIVRANHFACRILGYGSEKELIGTSVSEIYSDPDELEKLRNELRAEQLVENRILDMRCRDGREIIVQATNNAEVVDGNLLRRYCLFTDVTESQHCVRALKDLPMGYYAVDASTEGQLICRCNQAFAEMYGYREASELIGKVSILDLYADRGDQGDFVEKLENRHKDGKNLIGHRMLAKRSNGSTFWIEDDCRVVERGGSFSLREGTVRDVSKQKELEERVEISRGELDKYTEHIDRFMHKYISPMLRIDAALNMQRKMLEAIHIIPFRKDDSVSEVSGDDLEVGISMAVDALRPLKDAAATILGEELLRLKNILSRRHLYEDSPIEHVTTRGVAMGVLKALDTVPLEGPDHTLDALATYATGIATAAVERSIMITLSEIEGLKTIIEGLRRHLSRAAVEYDFRVMNVVRLVARSIELYAPMAAEERRRMITYRGPRELSAEIADVHVNRMISNMLLNAIKYSHLGRRDHSDPIEVRVEDKGNAFSISTWNYGVPIKRQEIESKKIYGFGYRGELSKDYNRNGSGIGLADISETAEAHKGYVEVTSVSTDEGADPEDYSRPFKTIVEVTLPKYRSERR